MRHDNICIFTWKQNEQDMKSLISQALYNRISKFDDNVSMPFKLSLSPPEFP